MGFFALQLGPDNNIYASVKDPRYNALGRISQANLAKDEVHWTYNAIPLNFGAVRSGLPNVTFFHESIATEFGDILKDSIICEGESMYVNLTGFQGEFSWGDGSRTKERSIAKAGIYRYKYEYNCMAFESEFYLEVKPCEKDFDCMPDFKRQLSSGDRLILKFADDCVFGDIHIGLYDHKGLLIIESSDSAILQIPDNLPVGLYILKYQYEGKSDLRHEHTSRVTIIK